MLQVYGHPFAAFYWTVLIALYERNVPSQFMMVDGDHPRTPLPSVGCDRPASFRCWSTASAR
jgi:hypothetical protein